VRAYYLFEFCDQTWIPSGARECLYEVMDACNSGIRSFNREVATVAIRIAKEQHLTKIVELGAGRAPVTNELVKQRETAGMQLVTCDLVPNVDEYKKLEAKYPDRVFPIYSSVDLTRTQESLDDGVLVLAGVMHHIPFELRLAVIGSLSATNSHVAIFEPLLRTWLSISMATLSFFPAILLPLTRLRRPGRLRRILWCWVVPIVPFMFVWDGVTSCLRQWTVKEWQVAFESLELSPNVLYVEGFNSLQFFWSGTNISERLSKKTSI
jgi:hypothetical protein